MRGEKRLGKAVTVTKHLAGAALGVCLMIPPGNTARASVFTDDLTRCLVTHMTPADSTVLIKWVFAAIALTPALKPMSQITDAQRTAVIQDAAKLFSRLVAEDCRKETLLAIKSDGATALVQGFQVLGNTAGRSIFQSPEAKAGLKSLGDYIKTDPQILSLKAEGGLPSDDK
jgi:hypothetical protein